MIGVIVLFWLLIIWSLYDGDLSIRESSIFVALWAVILVGGYLMKISPYWIIIPTVILDIILIIKIFGSDIQIW